MYSCPLLSRLPSPPGWQIRYTATQVLASRGSDKVPLDTLREMLDETQQERNHRLPMRDKIVSNQTDAQQVLLVGLKSLQEWLKYPDAVKSVGPDNPVNGVAYAIMDLPPAGPRTPLAMVTVFSDDRIWGLITVTDNATQRVTAFSPQ